jgi:hypothetical protein
LLLALLVVTFLLYIPGLRGDFIFDDHINIVTNSNVHLTDLTWSSVVTTLKSGMASTLSRPLSMLSFGINHYFSGLDPAAFKLTNVFIHLACTIGVYLLSRELLNIALKPGTEGQRRLQLLSLFIAACWALHPLNVSSVLFIVQRMTLLSSLTVIFALVLYCRFRQNDTASSRRAIFTFATICMLLVIGILFKESAALLVLFILTIELFLLHFNAAAVGQRLFLRLYFIFLLIIPAIFVMAVLAVAPKEILGSYEIRDFTMWERLLTECRILWDYIYWLLMPDTRLFTLYHDSYPVSHGLLDPPTTLAAAAGLIGLMAFAWLLRKRLPLLCFGIAFFLAGHAMESTVVALELVFEHRNYLPSFGLLLGGIYTLLNLPQFLMRKEIAGGFLALFLVFLAHGTLLETRKWSNAYDQLLSNVQQYPDSHRINYGLGYLNLSLAARTPDVQETLEVASRYFQRAATLDARATRGHIGYLLANSQRGAPMDPALIDDLVHRLQDYPLEENGLTDISVLTECWYGGFCKFDKTTLTRLYNAIADNAVSDPLVLQAILDQVGTAIVDVFKNVEDGKAILYLAKSQREDMTIIELKLIQLEMSQGNYTAAREILRAALSKPDNANFREELERLDAQLTLLENAP